MFVDIGNVKETRHMYWVVVVYFFGFVAAPSVRHESAYVAASQTTGIQRQTNRQNHEKVRTREAGGQCAIKGALSSY